MPAQFVVLFWALLAALPFLWFGIVVEEEK
jgi:hypothetical protein